MIRRFPKELEHRREFAILAGDDQAGMTLPEAVEKASGMKRRGEDPRIYVLAFSKRELKAVLDGKTINRK